MKLFSASARAILLAFSLGRLGAADALPAIPPPPAQPAASYLANAKVGLLWQDDQTIRALLAGRDLEIARLNALLAAATAAPAPAPVDVSALTQQITNLSQQLSASSADLSTVRTQTFDIAQRLGALEQSVSAIVHPAPETAHDLVLSLTGDFYQGSPEWEIWVDGTRMVFGSIVNPRPQIGIVRVAIQPGWTRAELRFTNDLYDGSPDKDRNLYLVAATLDGKPIDLTTLDLTVSGASTSRKLTADGLIGGNASVRIPLVQSLTSTP